MTYVRNWCGGGGGVWDGPHQRDMPLYFRVIHLLRARFSSSFFNVETNVQASELVNLRERFCSESLWLQVNQWLTWLEQAEEESEEDDE